MEMPKLIIKPITPDTMNVRGYSRKHELNR
jgi:hypothetical protein